MFKTTTHFVNLPNKVVEILPDADTKLA
jgi:hypothetical protein